MNLRLKSLTLCSLILIIAAPPPATATPTSIPIGDTTIESRDDNGNGNLLVAQQATLSQTATIQSLSFYVNALGGKLRLGLYTNDAGSPGALLASTNEFTPTSTGWNTQNVVSPASLTAGTYWLAYLPQSDLLGFKVSNYGSGTDLYTNFSYGRLPATFPGGSSWGAVQWSFYATLNTESDPIAVELAEKTPPGDPGDPILPGPPPPPTPDCVPIDCGGYFACSCQVCCANSPEPCYQTETSSVLQAALDVGCTLAPGNDCNTCPTPTLHPKQSCVWVSVWGEETDEFFSEVQLPMGSDQVAVPGCFASKWDQDCGDYNPDFWSVEGNLLYAQWSRCGDPARDLGTFLGDPEMTQGTGYTTEPNGGLRGAYWYMDANCHWTFPGPNTEICGVAAVCVTPISLLWDENASLSDGMTVVPFSINARQPEAFSLWKASEKAPLLVYDPKHTGKVTSAKQLFGTYTFGGKIAKAAYYQSEQARTPWGDGYEALASLDTNDDEMISGKELDVLALWFDKNRDGVSQPGEVEALSTLGMVALYYKPDRTDPKSGDIRANLGYERLVNGKLVKGASVDWFAHTFPTRQAAMVGLGAIFQEEKTTSEVADDELDARAAAAHDRPNDPLTFFPHQAKNHREDLSGYWYWTVKEKGGENHPGLFAFEQSGEHKLTGYSIVEAPLAENDQHLRSAVSALPATGTIKRDKDGRLQVAMKIVDRQSGGTARSTATLSDDGTMLFGKTTQLLVVEGNGKRRSASVDYEWVARKFAAPTKAANKEQK